MAAAPVVDKNAVGTAPLLRYDLMGRRLPGAAHGINILKPQGGRPVKVLVK